jgi:hypothetical protein
MPIPGGFAGSYPSRPMLVKLTIKGKTDAGVITFA